MAKQDYNSIGMRDRDIDVINDKKKKMTEAQTKSTVDAINEKYGEKKPTPKGIDTGKFGAYVKRSTNRLQEGGAVPTYTNKPGVSRAQFDNYAKQIKKNNPGTKARFNYNK
jgi:hypothetical protein